MHGLCNCKKMGGRANQSKLLRPHSVWQVWHSTYPYPTVLTYAMHSTASLPPSLLWQNNLDYHLYKRRIAEEDSIHSNDSSFLSTNFSVPPVSFRLILHVQHNNNTNRRIHGSCHQNGPVELCRMSRVTTNCQWLNTYSMLQIQHVHMRCLQTNPNIRTVKLSAQIHYLYSHPPTPNHDLPNSQNKKPQYHP